ncbi:4Fe-4S dicluster domain-containing protein [Halodesulfurarchaeum sp. HSR-GB]|uniref:4Fe-4S dicluster domain-containing protein n=1 Tax=Halodesulfurarchaeum sp. HSR-GB TaxID=3074077 RepID=UPI002865839D|nr:4Fe-4S dicluster domain-containing protein [Halodesulfurarchaeum sp. HSR-GB]MDR5657479.1 4Fe-4S dicluster domain-containing protein [Halodesulfurarchaeum sp. HSR-GB]
MGKNNTQDEAEPSVPDDGTSRRNFLKGAAVGAGVVGTGATAGVLALNNEDTGESAKAIPASEGYLLVDPAKCTGCTSCMIACSTAHEGKASHSLARIQITQNPFEGFPNDINQEQCRQCTYAACVEACPTGALEADPENGNVRMVDEDKCVGCQRCLEACPYTPHRNTWNHEREYAMKCDLCADTPHWDQEGGPDGSQACVEVCPVGAIQFTDEIPTQYDDEGYKVNLRDEQWEQLGLYAGDI